MLNIKRNFSNLGEKFFSYVKPSPIESANLIHINQELVEKLGLGTLKDNLLLVTNAAQELEGFRPLASIYAGHQFGIFVPQLGDGRALLIAEHFAPDNKIYELQLKGAGRTPYSRMGDGLAVLRSSIREYLASHAMLKLGINTTEAIALIHSKDTPVYRESVETAAIVLRVARSFIRFGHFELFASRNQKEELNQLTKFVIDNYYPDIDHRKPDFILDLLDQVSRRTAEMLAAWQAVGFTHGVMNTDNMSIIGLTIDYGPYTFMDTYRPRHAYNHSDSLGRYVYANQPDIGFWNLCRLAEALSLIYPYPEKLENTLAKYVDYYKSYYTKLMSKKMGFYNEAEFKLELCDELVKIMQDYQMDWTYTWRQLSYGSKGLEELTSTYNLGKDFNSWYLKWQELLKIANIEIEHALETMKKYNPAIVLRNHLLKSAIEKAEGGDYSEVGKLFQAISTPFNEQVEFSSYYRLPPSWAKHIELSCSS